MNELALFAGGGGSLLAGQLCGWRTRCAVELDPYCRAVLLARQRDGMLEPFPIWDNVCTFDGKPWHGHIDLITGGFPCQPWSVAGKQQGESDSRNLWPDTYRVLCEVRPRYAFFENVPGLLVQPYMRRILSDCAAARYDALWTVLGASDVGAPHLRKRLWILLADAERDTLRVEPGRQHGAGGTAALEPGEHGTPADVADASGTGGRAGNLPAASWQETAYRGTAMGHAERQGLALWQSLTEDAGGEQPPLERAGDGGGTLENTKCLRLEESGDSNLPQGTCWTNPASDAGWWTVEPDVGRVVNGLANRVDRLKALGNGWVPHCAAMAWHLLKRRLDAVAFGLALWHLGEP